VNVDELWQAGERIWNLRRAIMVLRENRHRDDDTLSHDLFEGKSDRTLSTFLSGPLDTTQWEALKDRYYELCGWNVKTGVPARARLEELGMKDVADKLQGSGKIG